jgi:hypothetical protein
VTGSEGRRRRLARRTDQAPHSLREYGLRLLRFLWRLLLRLLSLLFD